MVIIIGEPRPFVDATDFTQEDRDKTPFVDAMTSQDPDPLEDECWAYLVDVKLSVPKLVFPYQKFRTSKRVKTDRRDKRGRIIWEEEEGLVKLQYRAQSKSSSVE